MQQELDVIVGAIVIVGIWYILCFAAICTCLKKNFNFEFKRITAIGNKIREFIFKRLFKYIFFIGFEFAMIMCFFAAYDVIVRNNNILQCVMLIIVGLVFGIGGYFFYNIIRSLTSKDTPQKKNTKKINKKTNDKLSEFISIDNMAPLIFILFGLVFILAFFEFSYVKNAEETTALIIDTVFATRDDEKGDLYNPVIQYEVDDKQYIKKIENVRGKYKIGQELTVVYNSENPYDVKYKAGIEFFIMGIIFFLIGVFLKFNGRVKKK